MVQSILAFEANNKSTCLRHSKNVAWRLRDLLLIFYKNMRESRIAHSVWLSRVQGFQGWGVGRMIDGEFVKYDGLSGNHVLFFQALDAFLGLDRYLTDENMNRYIPVNQRELCLAFKRHSFRNKLDDGTDLGIRDELTRIANHLKVRLLHIIPSQWMYNQYSRFSDLLIALV